MRTTFELRTPDEVECSLTITGRIKDMKTLRTQLVDAGKATHWPLFDIITQIDEAIRKAESQITVYENTKP